MTLTSMLGRVRGRQRADKGRGMHDWVTLCYLMTSAGCARSRT